MTDSLVNSSGSFAFDGSLGGLVQTYYDTKAQDRLMQNLVFYSLCDKKKLPANSGGIYQFYRYDQISGSTLTAAIAENTTTANQSQLSAQVVNLTAKIYGTYVTLSKYGTQTLRSRSLVEDAVDVLSDTVSDIVDNLVRINLNSNAKAFFGADLAKTSATIVTTDIASASMIRKAVRNLQTDKIRSFADGQKYALVIHPYHWFDISSETNVGGFLTSAQYGQADKIWNGQVGSLFGARMLISQNITQTATASLTSSVSGTAFYSAYIVGQGALAAVSLEDSPIQMVIKTEGGTYDPYSNLVTVAAKLPGFGIAWLGTDVTTTTFNKRAYNITLATTA